MTAIKFLAFLGVFAVLLGAGVSASPYAIPYRGYSGSYVTVGPTYVTGGAYAPQPYGLSASYLAHLWGPSTRVTYTDDKYATSYSSRVSDGMGNTWVEGYYAPKPYRWECAGNGCSRTQYLAGLRVDALRPSPGLSYSYTMSRTW